MNAEQRQQVIDFLEERGIDVDFKYHLGGTEFKSADEIRETLEEGNAFDKEVIYYDIAMEYLMKHDNSLRRSLEIADQMGFYPGNLSSEILASLLQTQLVREDFENVFDDLQEFIDELEGIEKTEIEPF